MVEFVTEDGSARHQVCDTKCELDTHILKEERFLWLLVSVHIGRFPGRAAWQRAEQSNLLTSWWPGSRRGRGAKERDRPFRVTPRGPQLFPPDPPPTAHPVLNSPISESTEHSTLRTQSPSERRPLGVILDLNHNRSLK